MRRTNTRQTVDSNRPTAIGHSVKRRTQRSHWSLLALVLLLALLAYFARWPIAAALRQRARASLDAHQPAGALAWLDRAAWVAGEHAESEFLYARTHRKLRNADLFERRLSHAVELGLSPQRTKREQWLLAAQLGRLSVAEPRLNDLLSDQQNDGLEIVDSYVRGYIAARRLSDAIRLANALRADFPDDAQPHLLRGLIFRELNVLEMAEAEFRQALARQPAHPEATLELAKLLDDRQRWDEALLYYARCSEMPEHSLDAQIGAARCLRILGHTDEARSRLEALAGAAAPPQSVLLELGRLELECGNYDKSLHWCRQAAAAPRDAAVRAVLAGAKSAAGHKQSAAEDFEFVALAKAAAVRVGELKARVDADPRDALARCEIGRLQLSYGAERDGLRWLNSALDIDPECSAAHLALGQYYQSLADGEPQFAELARRHVELAEQDQ